MLNTTRLPFKMLALPYCSLIWAGLAQRAASASWNQASSSTFASGYRLASSFSGLLEITRIYICTGVAPMQVKCSHFGKITSSTNRLGERRTMRVGHLIISVSEFLLSAVFSRSEDGDVAPHAALKNGLGCSAE